MLSRAVAKLKISRWNQIPAEPGSSVLLKPAWQLWLSSFPWFWPGSAALPDRGSPFSASPLAGHWRPYWLFSRLPPWFSGRGAFSPRPGRPKARLLGYPPARQPEVPSPEAAVRQHFHYGPGAQSPPPSESFLLTAFETPVPSGTTALPGQQETGWPHPPTPEQRQHCRPPPNAAPASAVRPPGAAP